MFQSERHSTDPTLTHNSTIRTNQQSGGLSALATTDDSFEKSKNMDRNLNELEGTVLGLIGIKGPCTPYVVRKDFQKSASLFWSGSAGTIYPLIERLARHKLIKHASTKDDKRGGNLYVLTRAGEKALKDWLYQPDSAIVIGIPPDPLRNRIG